MWVGRGKTEKSTMDGVLSREQAASREFLLSGSRTMSTQSPTSELVPTRIRAEHFGLPHGPVRQWRCCVSVNSNSKLFLSPGSVAEPNLDTLGRIPGVSAIWSCSLQMLIHLGFIHSAICRYLTKGTLAFSWNRCGDIQQPTAHARNVKILLGGSSENRWHMG